ncbi:MAG: helicase-related protein, partial [Planctomycetota bacterium]
VPTVADTERLAGFLTARGHDVAAYSGRLDTSQREHIEDDLRANRLKAVVATSALGMGYDKPDLGFCLHVGSPDSPVAYYQQVGRAGRAIARAEAVLLPAETDERLWQYFATASSPDPGDIETVLGVLKETGEPMSVPNLVSITGVRRGRLEALLKIVAVDGAVERVAKGWHSTGETYSYDNAKWDQIRAVRAAEADLMRSYAGGLGCLMEFLQQALDDPDPGPCGRCSICTEELPAQGRIIDPVGIEAARVYLHGIDVIIEPRKFWPNSLSVARKGRIEGASEGRALTFADSPGWQTAALAVAGPDRPLDDESLNGMIAVLTRWRSSWKARPVAVIPMPSRRHPKLIGDLAARIAEVGKIPLVDALAVEGPRPPDGVASGLRVEAVTAGLSLRQGVTLPSNGPVLLIDDSYRSGWTMTVAAALLKDAGVNDVMPLVVHQLP